jgi:hypothetical protein
VRLRLLGVLGVAGVIGTVTATVRPGQVAATPGSFAAGRIWLLATSAFVADRPAAASIAGFALVGAVTILVAGTTTTVVAAAVGHIGSAVAVYLALGLVRIFVPTAFAGAIDQPDFGTSAIIAAWIGVLAALLWSRRRRSAAVALCCVSALVGWYLKRNLTILDAEHAVALVTGIAAVRVHATIVLRRSRLVARNA